MARMLTWETNRWPARYPALPRLPPRSRAAVPVPALCGVCSRGASSASTAHPGHLRASPLRGSRVARMLTWEINRWPARYPAFPRLPPRFRAAVRVAERCGACSGGASSASVAHGVRRRSCPRKLVGCLLLSRRSNAGGRAPHLTGPLTNTALPESAPHEFGPIRAGTRFPTTHLPLADLTLPLARGLVI